jgi:succinyl-diaminopimelate desuccinylase
MRDLQRVFKKIEDNTEMMVGLQAALTAVPAIAPESGGSGETAKAELLLQELHSLGLADTRDYPAPDARVPGGKRPNIVVNLPGARQGPALWIMSHLDVVPPGEESNWKSDPFRMVRKNGRLYGRGTEDNQQGMVSSIAAAVALLGLGLLPPQPVRLLFVSDEETGSEYGIRHLLANTKLFGGEDRVLVPDGGSPDGSMIQIAEKSLLWLKFQTLGKQCHASTPGEGKNAFLAGSELVCRLSELNRLYSEENPLFDPPRSTFAPTKKEANVPNINTIPADDVFYLDCRVLPGIDLDALMARIADLCLEVEKKHAVVIRVSTVQRVSSPPTPEDSPLVASLKEALKTVYGVEPRTCGIGGGTVASYLRNRGIHTVVWSRLDETMHMPNEYCRLENMLGDARVMAALMLSGAG